MKIKSNQQGGIIYTPFIPTQQNQNTSATEESTPEKITGTVTKEIVDVLKENGIPSDVDNFLQQANSFLTRSSSLSKSSLFGGTDENHTINDLIRIQSMANKVKFNKELYDSSVERLSSENSWGEVAIDDRGKMYVYSEDNGIELIDPNKYYQNADKYSALTNSQLLALRENNPEMSFNQGILQNLKNSVGMQTITNYLKQIIKDFGTNTVEGYTTKDRNSIEEGFRALMMNGPDGYYKFTNKDQGTINQDINMALNYLKNAMSPNMLQLLRAKTAAEGGNPNSSQDVYKLLGMALAEHTSVSRSVNFDKTATDSGSGSGKSSTQKKTETTIPEVISRGYQAPIQNIEINPKGSDFSIYAKAQFYGPPKDRHGDQIPQTNLQQLLGKSVLGSIVDKNSVSFGSTPVDSTDLDLIVWDGTSQMARIAALPYKILSSGSYVPDFEVIDKYQELSEKIEKYPNATPQEKNSWASELGVYIDYDSETGKFKWNANRTMPFMQLQGFTSDETFFRSGFDIVDKRWVQQVDKSKAKGFIDRYNNYVNYGVDAPSKGAQSSDRIKGKSWNLYQGSIFMAINDAESISAANANSLIPEEMRHYGDLFEENTIKTNW